jgi:predicted DNA-binding transcriptional regulator AlpA
MTIDTETFSSQEQLRQLLTLLMSGTASLGTEPDVQQSQQSAASNTIGIFDPLSLNRVVPRLKAIEIAGVSEATWDRVERRGEGPRRTQLSERRVGYRVRDLLAWLDARTKAAA